jgi:type I restriction-modification system DNA methylase subunit/restriction endonuclease S subunit
MKGNKLITKENFKQVLEKLDFINNNEIYTKNINDFELKSDFNKEELIFPKELIVNDKTTSNFSSDENFVVFECVHKLLIQGYHPKHIELEKKWQLGHSQKSGKADIYIKDNDNNALLIIECKTSGNEYKKAINILENDSRNQLFSYLQQATSTKFLALYASDFVDNQVVSNYYLINVCDNKELLENNSKLKSYKEANTTEEKYQVWVDTYDKEYSTLGIFEDNKPYEIGKTKFTSNDLKNINSKDIQGKYHQFATILRQHNVSGRENAFDKLVNLFLCKVVDEKENSDELKFYWKGKAYDNPFDFQDRLQQLYKIGMKEFLGEDITYVDNSHVDNIFSLYDLDTIKKDIKSVLTQLKFFTNNDFAFIDVHNEKLFYQNFEVLLKIARMIQDISLTGSDENQFLGDMFEGFLDQGIKQSEGQFFTPMPIVKFIINSLPNKSEPKVIDYACGAGHFLNEYFATNNNSQIVGIEKEYRLSKVAKVSSFMYGSDIQIIHDDALKKSEKIKDKSFDVLIANPPYSVKGFLETLSVEERNNYELINTIEEKSYSANNAIECFFIERSKQLLSKDGVAGIVVPSSILNKGNQNITSNKGNVYVNTREIILKYFNIIAIAEFGSGTFGKTGTNTVTLFLKRRDDNQNLAGTFQELADKTFSCKLEFKELLQDKELIEKYCNHIGIDFDIYKSILCTRINKKLFENDTFKEYKTEFGKLTETKNRRKKKYFKELLNIQKCKLEHKEFLNYIKAIEKDKFYYFTLAYKNNSDVVIVKSPSKNNENKKFLGYEWSSAKGNEGIKYLTSINIDDETLEEEDKRILENLQGLKDINTPLYNPKNSDDNSKINKIIKDNFEGIKTEVNEDLKEFVSHARLVDMMDFSRVDFNKALSLSPSKKVEIDSKYPIKKLSEISKNILAGGDKPKNFSEIKTPKLNIPIYSNSITNKGLYGFTDTARITEYSLTVSARGTIGYTVARKEPFYPIVRLIVITPKSETANIDYLKEILNFYGFESNGTGVAQLTIPIVENTKIPLPPLDIQEQIVKECQKVDDEVLKANETIEQTKKDIANEINSVSGDMVKISEISENLDSLRVPIAKGKRKEGIYPYYGASGIVDYVDGYVIDDYVLLISEDGANLKTRNTPIAFTSDGKAWINNHAHILRFGDKATHKLVEIYLNQMDLSTFITGQAQPKLSQANLNQIKIPFPSIETQKQIVSKIGKLETKIDEAKKVVDSAKDRKEGILKKYL